MKKTAAILFLLLPLAAFAAIGNFFIFNPAPPTYADNAGHAGNIDSGTGQNVFLSGVFLSGHRFDEPLKFDFCIVSFDSN